MQTFTSILCLGVATCAVASYPASYPFENESYVPADVPAGTPNYAYDDTDTGGYVYTGAFTLSLFDGTLTDDDFPYWPHQNGFAWYNLVSQYAAPPILPASVFNCSLNDLFFKPADYTGMVNGKKVCNTGECCEYLMGQPKFGDDQLSWHDWFDQRVAAGMCDLISEDIYCVMVGGHFHLNCMQYYLAPTERLVKVLACYDSWTLYYLTCPVYKQAYTYMIVLEPDQFMDSLSAEENIITDCGAFAQDRLCHPYSYYYPQTTSDSESETDSSKTSSTASSDSSAAASLAVVATLFLL